MHVSAKQPAYSGRKVTVTRITKEYVTALIVLAQGWIFYFFIFTWFWSILELPHIFPTTPEVLLQTSPIRMASHTQWWQQWRWCRWSKDLASLGGNRSLGYPMGSPVITLRWFQHVSTNVGLLWGAQILRIYCTCIIKTCWCPNQASTM